MMNAFQAVVVAVAIAMTNACGTRAKDSQGERLPNQLGPVSDDVIANLKVREDVQVIGALPTEHIAAGFTVGGVSRDASDGGSGDKIYSVSDAHYTGIFGHANAYVDRIAFHGAKSDSPIAQLSAARTAPFKAWTVNPDRSSSVLRVLPGTISIV